MKRKKGLIKMLIMLVFMVIYFGSILMKQYEYTRVSKDDLSYAEITYGHYAEGPNSKNKERHIIYSAEGVAYGFGSIVDVNEALLSQIDRGSKVEIYYLPADDSYYSFEIIEMYYKDEAIMTVNDYHEDYSAHLKLSLLIIIGFILFLSFFMFIFPRLLNKALNKKYGLEKIDFESEKAKAKYKDFKEAIRFDGKGYYADLTNSFDEGNFDIQVLCKFLYDEMDSQEIRLIYEDTAVDEIAYLAFKYNGKVMFEAVFRNKEGNMEIDENLVSWSYPAFSEFNQFEKKMYDQSVAKYSQMHNIKIIHSKPDEENYLIKNKRKKK
jgi:hypothetical protein